MAAQLQYNKEAILLVDKLPAYRDVGEVWGKNKLDFSNWDHIEQAGACLDNAAYVSQFQEGDKYITSSSVIPMMYSLMATSSPNHDVFFSNRANDEFNDAALNPVNVAHDNLDAKVKEKRWKYHNQLIDRFDFDVDHEAKKSWLPWTRATKS